MLARGGNGVATGRGGGVVDFIADLGGKKFKNAERDAHNRLRNLFGCHWQPYELEVTVAGDNGPEKIHFALLGSA